MFPACPLDVIRGLLGPNPTKERAREVANLLSSEMEKQGGLENMLDANDDEQDCATCDSSVSTNRTDDNSTTAKDKVKKKKSSFMGKMLKGLPGGGMGGMLPGAVSGGMGGIGGGNNASRIKQEQAQSFSHNVDSNAPSSPEQDASTQNALENMLNSAVQSSQSVDNAGVRSPETLLRSLPQGLDRKEDGCEVIPAQNLQPYKGPHGDYKTRNGIKVFSGKDTAPSFLSQNFSAAERFSVVLQQLATVYKLHLRTLAIYYEPNGGTIAFNSNKALYFNLRFFCALHQSSVDRACYSYWYMVFAHELAHNLVTAHNKEHGSFTESIAALYLPDFVKLLDQA